MDGQSADKQGMSMWISELLKELQSALRKLDEALRAQQSPEVNHLITSTSNTVCMYFQRARVQVNILGNPDHPQAQKYDELLQTYLDLVQKAIRRGGWSPQESLQFEHNYNHTKTRIDARQEGRLEQQESTRKTVEAVLAAVAG